MKKFIISGGNKLKGEVEVSGSKNAALPLIFASLAIPGESILKNVPDIGDVSCAVEIIRELGAVVERQGAELRIITEKLSYVPPRDELTRKIRASTYLLGACLARFGRSKISDFGGCSFDKRPIDLHLFALECLGAEIRGDNITLDKGRAADIHFPRVSVGASINALITASSLEGKTRIYGYAKEPHVVALVDFLRSAGVLIEEYSDRLEVSGAAKGGGCATVIPDMIEAGTYLAAATVTDSELFVRGADAEHLTSFIKPLQSAGVEITQHGEGLYIKGKPQKPILIETAPYPGFPTDLQPIIAPALAFSFGGEIRESIWNKRFSYLNELRHFGVKSSIDGNCARIFPSKPNAAIAKAPDLRGGAALILSALAAKGDSVVYSAETVLRGYEKLAEKLSSIGAVIRIKN